MVATRIEASAHAPAERFSIMPILNRKKKRCEELKVIMLGDAGVGKSSLVAALAQRSSPHDSTGVDFQVKMATLNNEIVKMQLWDTADQEKFGINALPKSYFRRARGVFLMYDVANRQSFRNAVRWAIQLQALTANTDPLGLVLVANQSHTNGVECGVVSSTEGRALAAMLRCRFVSSSSTDSAEACFEALIDEISSKTPWEANLSDTAARLAAIEADMETKKEAEAASETESEDEDILGLDNHEPVGPQSISSISVCSLPESRSLVRSPDVNQRRTSTALELGLVGSKNAGVASLPTARELLRGVLFVVCVLLFVCPFTLLFLLQDDSQEPRRSADFAGVVGRLLWSSFAQ